MAGLALLILLAVMVVATLVALLPWRDLRVRAWMMAAQVAASVVLPFVLPSNYDQWQIWAVPLAPGALIALIRLIYALNKMSYRPQRPK